MSAGYEPGDSLPEHRITPDKYLTHRYAGASGDFNPIHIDPGFATAVGLPGAILHGLYSMAQVARAVNKIADDDPRALKRLSVQFRGMGVPEKEITVSATVASAEGTLLRIEAEAEQDGTRIIRNAVAEVDTAGSSPD